MLTPAAERLEPGWPARIGWAGHWLLRVGLALSLLVYGWAKVWLLQMGRADFGDALVTFGEMSPMGLLWRFVAYSPIFQMLSGVAEVAAAALLLWRRTAGVGAAVAAFDMLFVFLLNMAYDVPVKQPSLALAIAALIAAAPYVSRFLRAAFGTGPVPAGPLPTVFTGRVGRVAGVVSIVFAVAAVAGAGVAARTLAPPPVEGHPLAGVYRVTRDTAPAAAQLADDTRWQQVALGQWGLGDRGAIASVRHANGDLRTGSYRVSGDTVTLELDAVQRGPVTTTEPTELALELRFEQRPDGRILLRGDGQDLELTPDPERRFLFDRDFSWAPRPPVNR